MNGWIVHLVRLRPETDVLQKLHSIAGTSAEVTFWSGGTVEGPDYSWTFQGAELSADALANLSALDLSIALSASGQGLVSGLLAGSEKTLVASFSHSGTLPAPAVVYIAAPAYLQAGDALSLYLYDEQAGSFTRVLDGLTVESGYIAFEIDHCSTWAISASDLAALAPAVLPDALNPLGGNGPLEGTWPPLVYLLVGATLLLVLCGIGLALGLRFRRRKRAVGSVVDN